MVGIPIVNSYLIQEVQCFTESAMIALLVRSLSRYGAAIRTIKADPI